MPDSRLSAQVSFHQRGYAGNKVKLTVKEGAKTVATHEIVLKADGVEQTEQVLFNAGGAGVKAIEVAIEPLPSEENPRNKQNPPSGECRPAQASHSLYGRRASLGIQIPEGAQSKTIRTSTW